VKWRSAKSQSEDSAGTSLVKVAYARNLAEAELIQGLLRQEDIPSMVQRNGGFDVPDFLAAGPRDILVPESQAERARELLPLTRSALNEDGLAERLTCFARERLDLLGGAFELAVGQNGGALEG
jgi:hypothetical protein